jgi:serine/threonine protein kinase
LFTEIVTKQPRIPSELSSDCKDLLEELFIKNPDERLKISEVLEHPWLLPESSAPIVPDPYKSYVEEKDFLDLSFKKES